MKIQVEKHVAHWLIGPIEEQKMDFVPITMQGKMNQWMLEGFAIHDNPSRQEYVKQRKIPSYQPFQPEKMTLYLPWGNPNVEHSGFWFTPTHLRCQAVTWVIAEQPEEAIWRLMTCGAVTVYVNGELLTDFAPFTRNTIQKKEISFKLQEGKNEIYVFFEDIAERDTQYLFRLDYLGGQKLTIDLPVPAGKEIRKLEKAMLEAYLERDTTIDGSFCLHLRNPLPEAVTYRLKVSPHEILGDKKSFLVEGKLQPGQTELEVRGQLPIDFCSVEMTLFFAGQSITRGYPLQSYDEMGRADRCDSVAERRQKALEFIAGRGNNDIFRAIALLRLQQDIELAKTIIADFVDRIQNRYDCSDFYLAGLIYLWREYNDSGLWTAAEKNKIKEVILNFRYWMEEPGNDVMWFFSENHALMFHACELLAGGLFPNEIFPNSGFTGRKHQELAEERLKAWFESFLAEGITEWNSSAYIPIDALGFSALYLMGEGFWRDLAKQGLDRLFLDMAVFGLNGVLSCTFGRSYEKELKGNYVAGTSMMAAIAWGEGFYNQMGIAGTFLSLCDYSAPLYEKYRRISANKALIYQRKQGFQDYVSVYVFKTKDFSLSSAFDFRPGFLGYQQNVLHAYFTPTALVWINHPGEEHLHGSGRPNFWAGNHRLPRVWQYKGLAAAIYHLTEEDEVDYTHAYFPVSEFDEVKQQGNWHYARSGQAFIGLFAFAGLRLQEAGPNQQRELISEGKENLWLIRTGNTDEYTDFNDFIQQNEYEVVVKDGFYQLTDAHYGHFRLRFSGSNWRDDQELGYQVQDEIINLP